MGPTGTEVTERSTGELLRSVAQQAAKVARLESELARDELAAKGRRAGQGGAMLAVAAVLGLLAAMCVTACVVAAIHVALALWLSALVVGACYGGVAGFVALVGVRRLASAAPPAPERALETMKENLTWLRRRLKSARS